MEWSLPYSVMPSSASTPPPSSAGLRLPLGTSADGESEHRRLGVNDAVGGPMRSPVHGNACLR